MYVPQGSRICSESGGGEGSYRLFKTQGRCMGVYAAIQKIGSRCSRGCIWTLSLSLMDCQTKMSRNFGNCSFTAAAVIVTFEFNVLKVQTCRKLRDEETIGKSRISCRAFYIRWYSSTGNFYLQDEARSRLHSPWQFFNSEQTVYWLRSKRCWRRTRNNISKSQVEWQDRCLYDNRLKILLSTRQ